MRKLLFTSTMVAIMALFLLTACSEDSNDTVVAEKTKAQVKQVSAMETSGETGAKDDSIMDQPVNFSTPEDVGKTLANIREQAGARAARKLDSAMGWIMTYDLGVGRDEAKMYKKLNGKTPNQIISMVKR